MTLSPKLSTIYTVEAPITHTPLLTLKGMGYERVWVYREQVFWGSKSAPNTFLSTSTYFTIEYNAFCNTRAPDKSSTAEKVTN